MGGPFVCCCVFVVVLFVLSLCWYFYIFFLWFARLSCCLPRLVFTYVVVRRFVGLLLGLVSKWFWVLSFLFVEWCVCVCLRGSCVALLYESPGGNQVDGLPPAVHEE